MESLADMRENEPVELPPDLGPDDPDLPDTLREPLTSAELDAADTAMLAAAELVVHGAADRAKVLVPRRQNRVLSRRSVMHAIRHAARSQSPAPAAKGLVVAAATALIAWLTLLALAPASHASATITVGTSFCAVIDSNENCVPGPFHDVQTHNVNGVEIERASADGVFNGTGHAIHFTFTSLAGGPLAMCTSDVTGATTSDYIETLSASGQATIVCRFRAP
jgi:hypothetical protein